MSFFKRGRPLRKKLKKSLKTRHPSNSAIERYRALYRSSSVPTRKSSKRPISVKKQDSFVKRMSRKLSHKKKRFANIGADDASSGFDGDVSEVSSLSRERSYSNRFV